MSGRISAIIGMVVAWWFIVVLPGLLTVGGTFGDIGVNTVIPGKLVGTWIGCFCAQLAMIYVIGHYVGHVRSWWFFVASMLPWAVDWASPVSLFVACVAFAVAAGFAVLIAVLALRTVHLDEHGTQVDATVIKVLRNYMNIVINNVYIRRRVRVQFALPGGQPQQRTLHMLCEIGTGPSAGDHIKLRIDPRHPHHLAVDSSELSS